MSGFLIEAQNPCMEVPGSPGGAVHIRLQLNVPLQRDDLADGSGATGNGQRSARKPSRS